MKAARIKLFTGCMWTSLVLVGLFPPYSVASSLTLAWDPNSEPDLAGYKIYYGTYSGDYDFVIDAGNANQYRVSHLEPYTRYYFSLTAYDTSWNESDLSEEVSAVTGDEPDPLPPPAPGLTYADDDSDRFGYGCFIATAAYGSYLHPHVRILREFRDEFLISNSIGRKCVNLYYRYGPRIADIVGTCGFIRYVARLPLLPLTGMGSLFLKTMASPTSVFLPLCLLLLSTVGLPLYRHLGRARSTSSS